MSDIVVISEARTLVVITDGDTTLCIPATITIGDSGGDMNTVIYDPQTVQGDVFLHANNTDLATSGHPASVISGLSTAAVAAMGVKDDSNPLNHDRYTDGEASAAAPVQAESDPIVGAVSGLVKANGLGGISAAVKDTDYQGVLAEGAFADGDKNALGLNSGYRSVGHVPLSQKGAANGVTPLGADSKIASSYLPPIAITDTFPVDNEAEQLALTAQKGDIAVRSDENKSYVQNGGSAGDMTDWTLLKTPTDVVLSVAGEVGVISKTDLLTALNVADGAEANNISDTDATDLTDSGASTLHYHTSDRDRANHTGSQAISTVASLQTTLDAKIAKNQTDTLGNLTATPSFTGVDNTTYSGATYSADVTTWAGITLASGAYIALEGVDNTGGYTIAATGLTAIESGALDDIASDGVNLWIANLGGTLFGRATINP